MKALILAAGTGSRLKPLTDNKPKCLVKLNKETILEHEINHFLALGIKEFVILTGAFEDQIEALIEKKYPKINVTYVHNPQYAETNYIYSVWLGKDAFDDDIISMHGDMVLDRVLLKKLIKSKHKNAALVNNKMPVPEKDFKCRVKNDVITEIGVNVFGDGAYFCAPVYKFSKEDFHNWVNHIDRFVKEGRLQDYAETAFNEIAEKIELKPVYYQDEFCMEIDNKEDLAIAKKNLKGIS